LTRPVEVAGVGGVGDVVTDGVVEPERDPGVDADLEVFPAT